MRAEEFVKELAAIAPNMLVLENLGLDAASAKEFIQAYQCQRRPTPLKFAGLPANDNLTDLFNGWDPSRATIGMIQLLSEPRLTARGVQVGVDEADPLIISAKTGELVVEEAGTSGHILGMVSATGDRFLDALIIAAHFLTNRSIGNSPIEDAETVAGRCATAAGGNDFLSFWLYLVG